MGFSVICITFAGHCPVALAYFVLISSSNEDLRNCVNFVGDKGATASSGVLLALRPTRTAKTITAQPSSSHCSSRVKLIYMCICV